MYVSYDLKKYRKTSLNIGSTHFNYVHEVYFSRLIALYSSLRSSSMALIFRVM